MNIKLEEITVRQIASGFSDKNEEGVVGYGGKLNIRPKYQREYVYKALQRDSVLDTVKRGFPLNLMYWAKNHDGGYEVLDGQQRTISICQYVHGVFSLNGFYFHSLEDDEKENILSYKLMVYVCDGSEREKLDWFKTINIAGEPLRDQELRNSVYTGTWLTDAKRYFSKTGCAAHFIAQKYLRGEPLRQDYLETVLKWISKDNIEEYMSKNQHNENAMALYVYFKDVIDWVSKTFVKYRSEMKGLDYGYLYDNFGDVETDSIELEESISKLMGDEDVTKKSGVYYYVFDKKESWLSIRSFKDNQKREKYEQQKGVCVKCQNHFEIEGMEADHIKPWSEGGKTVLENCQMLCKNDNRIKSNK